LRKDIVNVVELQPDILIKDVIKLAMKIKRQQKKKEFSSWDNSKECFKIYFHIFTNMECT
jgi:hypothetical protein